MALNGKGFMIWKVRDCEGGSPSLIKNAALSAGLQNVLIKIADGASSYNIVNGVDQAASVVQTLKANNIEVWGWHYIYGSDPAGEAAIAIKRVKDLGLDGYIIDAESQFEASGMSAKASTFMTKLRAGLPNKPVALSSFRFPTYHSTFPWSQFLSKCDFNMPQVYWQDAHNPEDQLRRTVKEFANLSPSLPVIPTGPVYKYGDWQPTNQDTVEFMNTAQTLKLASVNFFTWDYKTIFSGLWDYIAAYPWATNSMASTVPQLYIDRLNTTKALRVVSLYRTDAVHITPTETVQGTQNILGWYSNLLNKTLPNATFTLVRAEGTSKSMKFYWNCQSPKGRVENGYDTVGLINGKIVYHHSQYKVLPV
jgi:hypothetical protein